MGARAKVIVHYEDGTKVEFNPNKPRLLLTLEKRYAVQAPETHAQVSWMAYYALVESQGKGGDVKFDDWLDSVEEFETVIEDDDDEGKAPDPS